MPITPFQSKILRLLAKNRNPDSYVAGATVLNRSADSNRYSKDIGLFHDPAVIIQDSFIKDEETLLKHGYEVKIVTEHRTFIRAVVSLGQDAVKLEWVTDSAFRFFPIIEDELLGYRLHDIDAATNKCLAFAGRRQARDLLDILYIHKNLLHLGALCFAASGKDLGLTPDLILDFINRNSAITPTMLEGEETTTSLDLKAIKQEFLSAFQEAEELVLKLPSEHVGCVFVDSTGAIPRVPSPDSKPHSGSFRGAWPSIADAGER